MKTRSLVTRKIGVDMTYWKHIDQEVRELDFAGLSAQSIADQMGLSVSQVMEILDEIEDPMYYANIAADQDAEHYGNA